MSLEPYSTQNTIFPDGIPTEIQTVIVGLTDNKSLSVLSLVSKCANRALSNDFFKSRYVETYQWLHPTPEILFPHFQKHFPSCCWKVISYFAESPSTKTLAQAATTYQTLKQSLAEEQIPEIVSASDLQNPEARVAELESRMADLDSQSQGLTDTLEPTPEYAAIETEFFALRSEHRSLSFANPLLGLEQKILGDLLIDQSFFQYPFSIINNQYSLCILNQELDLKRGYQTWASDDVHRSWIQPNIESRPKNLMTLICDILYVQYANGSEEPDWSQNHYHEYFPQLKHILKQLVEKINHFHKDYFTDLETRIKGYVTKHSESFQAQHGFLLTSLDIAKKFLEEIEEGAADYAGILAKIESKIPEDADPSVKLYMIFLRSAYFKNCLVFAEKESVKEALEKHINVFELMIKYSQ